MELILLLLLVYFEFITNVLRANNCNNISIICINELHAKNVEI